MAGRDYSSSWLSAEALPRYSSTDSDPYDPLLYSSSDGLAQGQSEGAPQNPYELFSESLHDPVSDSGGTIWMPNHANPNSEALAVLPSLNRSSDFPRPTFRTAPPHFPPPSQIQDLRGYHTDPQRRNVQLLGVGAIPEVHFDQEVGIDLGHLTPVGIGYNPQMAIDYRELSHSQPALSWTNQEPGTTSYDGTAMPLIRNFVELYPTTFFYPEKVEALATITSLTPDTVRKIMTQVLEERRQGPSHTTTLSRTTHTPISMLESQRTTNKSLSSATTENSLSAKAAELQHVGAIFERSDDACSSEHRPVFKHAVEFLLERTISNCRPTSDQSLLLRDEEKIYQCTLKCGKSFTRKADLRRHEEERHYPQEGWMCDPDPVTAVENVPTCTYCRLSNPSMSHAHKNPCHQKEISAPGKVFTRRKRFVEHCNTYHPTLSNSEYVNHHRFAIHSKLPNWCGFCVQSCDFNDSKVRNQHMADHFEDGLDMTAWKDPLALSDGDDEGDNDDDADGDGNGKESDHDADHDMDDMEHKDFMDRGHQPDGGSARGVYDSQSNGANIDSFFSVLCLEGCTQTSRSQSTSQLRRKSRIASLDGFTAEKDATGRTDQELAPPFPYTGTDYEHSPQQNRLKWPNSSQLDFKLGQKTEATRKRSGAMGRSTMEKDLWNARVTYKSHRFFIPKTELRRLLTIDRVSRELCTIYSQIHQDDVRKNAERILNNATRLFALLILIGKADQVLNLMEEGIKDGDLPISGFRCKETQAFSKWKPEAIEDFKQAQWSFISPVFRIGVHYEFDDHTILPFIENREHPEQLITGGYSDVRNVKIHPAHLDMSWSRGVSQTGPFIAVKRLHSTDHTLFEKEARMLKELAKKNNPHIIRLLATYRLSGHYHLMFPWADKNLRTYWQDDPNPDWDREALLWDIKQMVGIASGLQTIHIFKNQRQLPSPSPDLLVPRVDIKGDEEEYLYGRHGDLKPENILWSKMDGPGTLQIADFGLGRFHGRNSRSQVDPRTIVSTPTYEPPEIALHKKVSRAYDIWSLGCLYLEYITWRLGGYRMLEAFGNARVTTTEDGVIHDKFYTLKDNRLTSPISPLPTRVINVGNIDTDPFLQETTGCHGRYAALSHCWGTTSRLTTTTESITHRKRRISISTLPETFRDAIDFCRASGVQYLWIDSLCIVQDSPEDKCAEICKMGSIFEGALFTLVATSPPNFQDDLSIKSNRDRASKKVKHPGKICVVHEVVHQWIIGLRSLDRCSGVIHDLLDLIEWDLLVVDASKRVTSTRLLEKLQDLATKAESDGAYLLSSEPRKRVLNFVENPQGGITPWDGDVPSGEELLNKPNAWISATNSLDAMSLACVSDRLSNKNFAYRLPLYDMDLTTCLVPWIESFPETLHEVYLKHRTGDELSQILCVGRHKVVKYHYWLDEDSYEKRRLDFGKVVVSSLARTHPLEVSSHDMPPMIRRKQLLLITRNALKPGHRFGPVLLPDTTFCTSAEKTPGSRAGIALPTIDIRLANVREAIQSAARAALSPLKSIHLSNPQKPSRKALVRYHRRCQQIFNDLRPSLYLADKGAKFPV